MKYLWIFVLFAVAIFGISGCSSTGLKAAGDPVPGEKTGDESRLQPGTSGGTTPSASVRW